MLYSCIGNDKSHLHKQLCATVEPTAIGEILLLIEGPECKDFYSKYLHDFIRLAHTCNHKDGEYEIQEYEVRMVHVLRIMYQEH